MTVYSRYRDCIVDVANIRFLSFSFAREHIAVIDFEGINVSEAEVKVLTQIQIGYEFFKPLPRPYRTPSCRLLSGMSQISAKQSILRCPIKFYLAHT